MGRITIARRLKFSIGLVAVSCMTLEPARAADDEAIGKAIERGIEFLLAQQATPPKEHTLGAIALETYALIVAGVSIENPRIKANFVTLKKQVIGKQHTYTLACYLFALDAAIAQIENDLLILQPKKVRAAFRDDPRIGREYRAQIDAAIKALVRNQNDEGGWHYGRPNGKFDNSNVQFAVLGLGIGAKRNVPIERKVWHGVVNHFLKWQAPDGKEVKERLTMDPNSDKNRVKLVNVDKKSRRSSGKKKDPKKKEGGRTVVAGPENPEVGEESVKIFQRGWGYSADKGYRWNMTCAGLSSLILARESLRGQMEPDMAKDLNTAIRDGYGWVMSHWTPTKSYYGIYSLEKVADIGHVLKFADHDWFEELSDHLIKEQRDDGSWKGGGSHGETIRVASSFALLVLNRASSLLTMSPGSRIVVSGRNAEGGVGDRRWVYVPALDVTMHYPTLMRTIKQRPSAKLIEFLRNIVDNYAAEWKGELIPDMARIRDDVQNRRVRKVLDVYLEDITGAKYKNWENYLVWHRRWERVMAIAEEQKRDRIPDLLKYYQNTSKSIVLKKAVSRALQRCKAREALPLFLADLEAKNSVIRDSAYYYFRQFFIDSPPPFDAKASEKVRKLQVAKIKAWFAKNGGRA